MRNRSVVMRWGSSVAASALFATLLVAVGLVVRDEAPVTRSAGVTDLCSGWSGCVSAGYSDAGYGAVSNRMYWNMYAGHNCTNYVAYRMIKAGMPATRPWVGGGNASEWGLQMAEITDQVPEVGSVAWWGRYSNGSGSAGHVGYVEKVVSANEIIISMDSWGGTFHWRRITKDSGRWPTGFIHFIDKKLTTTTPPAVTGTAQVGEQLRISPGTVSPAATRTFQWLADGVALPGQTTSGLRLTAALLKKTISVKVTAKRAGYDPLTVTTKPTAAVARGIITPGEQPVVSGEAYVANTLTATSGGWSPGTAAIEWRWYADNVRVPDAAGPTFTLTPEYDGKVIKVVTVARKDGYTTATAPAVAKVGPVLAGKIKVTAPVTVAGVRRVGNVLTAVPGTYTPAALTTSYQWLRNGVPIPGATARRYTQTARDVGRTLTVKTSLSKDRYIPAASTADSTGLTQSVPRVVVVTAGQRHRAVVAVRVVAPGVAPVNGWVDVSVAGKMRSVRLTNGVGRIAFEDLTAGTKAVKVSFRPTTTVIGKRWAGKLVVR